MSDCDVLRATLIGLPECCSVCHAVGPMTPVSLNAERLRICCTIMSEAMRHYGAALRCEWTSDEPGAPCPCAKGLEHA